MTEPRYSTISRRILAGMVDGTILTLHSSVCAWATNGNLVAWVAQTVMLSLVWYLYSVIMHVRYGGTVGKLICYIRVLDVSEQRNMVWRQALMRDSVGIALCVVGLVSLIGNATSGRDVLGTDISDRINMYGGIGWSVAEIVTALFNSKRRAIHDWMAGSVVVRLGVERSATGYDHGVMYPGIAVPAVAVLWPGDTLPSDDHRDIAGDGTHSSQD